MMEILYLFSFLKSHIKIVYILITGGVWCPSKFYSHGNALIPLTLVPPLPQNKFFLLMESGSR